MNRQSVEQYMDQLGQQARAASRQAAAAETSAKNIALVEAATAIEDQAQELAGRITKTSRPVEQKDSMQLCWIGWS